MKRILLLFLIFYSVQLLSQNFDTVIPPKWTAGFEKVDAEKLYADSVKHIEVNKSDTTHAMQRIFGCSCCMDTLYDYIDKSKTYVLTNNKTELTAYKSQKKKWTITTLAVFGSNDLQISCMDFYEINNQLIIRLLASNLKLHHVDINPRNGHLIVMKNK